jgi:hypothetical protein
MNTAMLSSVSIEEMTCTAYQLKRYGIGNKTLERLGGTAYHHHGILFQNTFSNQVVL